MKRKKIVGTLIGLFASFLFSAIEVHAANGTQNDPYLIRNCTELQNMKNNLSVSYALANDIDCSPSVSWNGGKGFEPIGSATQQFSGSFDGKGYTISGLTINRPADLYIGLFGYVKGASYIQNITLTNSKILGGTQYVGALAGYIDTAKTKNIQVTSDVTGGVYVGGVSGRFRSAEIINVHGKGTVHGEYSVGGIAGFITYSSASYVSYQGNVYAAINRAGGIAGALKLSTNLSYAYTFGAVAVENIRDIVESTGGLIGDFSDSTVQDSFSHMQVTCTTTCQDGGGLGGLIGASENGNVNRSYSIGKVNSTTMIRGGLIGLSKTSNITNSYWDKDTSGTIVSGGGTAKTSPQMKTQGTFTGWDFLNVWQMDATGVINNGYPYLLPFDETPPDEVSSTNAIETTNGIILSWNNPNDSDFQTVNIYKDGVKIGSSKIGSFIDIDKLPSKTYHYILKTVDRMGNESSGVAIDITTKSGVFELTAPNIQSFSNALLNGWKQIIETSFAGNIKIADNTGTGNGWNVTVAATPFKEVGGREYTLPSHSLVLQKPSGILVTSGDAMKLPTIQNGGPWVIDGGDAVKLVFANPGYGIGSYEITFPSDALELTIQPENVLIDQTNYPLGTPYTSTLTFTVVSGP